jgi:hypothetical protein
MDNLRSHGRAHPGLKESIPRTSMCQSAETRHCRPKPAIYWSLTTFRPPVRLRPAAVAASPMLHACDVGARTRKR